MILVINMNVTKSWKILFVSHQDCSTYLCFFSITYKNCSYGAKFTWEFFLLLFLLFFFYFYNSEKEFWLIKNTTHDKF